VQFDTSVDSRDGGEQEKGEGIAPCPFKKGTTEAEVSSS